MANPLDLQTLLEWRERVRASALDLGFSLVGFTTAEPLGAETERRWMRWLKTDRAGKMNYLRRASPRRTHPKDLLPEAQSIVVAAAGYFDGDHASLPESPPGDSPPKVARYAWGEDYHHVLRAQLALLAGEIRAQASDFGYRDPIQWRAVADSAPLDERALAVRAGLGFIGKNTLLLHPEHGSWMLLSELLISIPFPPDSAASVSALASCGSCRKCLEACPTQAILGPYELDPRRCISYLTIEQRDPIPPETSEKFQGWAFGCDICQEICPYNSRPDSSPLSRRLPELSAARGAGPYLGEEVLQGSPSGKGFLRRWGHTPLARVGLKGLLRNVAAVCQPGRGKRRKRRRKSPLE